MIPDGFIEDAAKYSVLPVTSNKPIPIGGRIMFNFVVKEQMTRDHIIATMGVERYTCMIMVDYSPNEIYEMIGIAKEKIAKISGSPIN